MNRLANRRGKQNHICVDCGRQFIDRYSPRGYSDWTKRLSLRMDVNDMGLRGIERVLGVADTSVLTWIEQVGKTLPDAYDPEAVPRVGELDELETFVGRKRDMVWIWTIVDHIQPGFLGWTIGDRSAKTFEVLWQAIACWQCYFWMSDGYKVYPKFIPDGDQIVSKT